MAVATPIRILLCPAAPDPDRKHTAAGGTFAPTDYTPHADVDLNLIATGLLAPWNGDPRGILYLSPGPRILDVPDGTSTSWTLTRTSPEA